MIYKGAFNTKKKIIMIMTIVMLQGILFGCVGKQPIPNQSTNQPIQSEQFAVKNVINLVETEKALTEFVERVKVAALGEGPKSCTIGQNQMYGQCNEIEEAWDGGKVIHKTYVCPLDSGDALLIETQWYTEQVDDSYEALLWQMINSIKIVIV